MKNVPIMIAGVLVGIIVVGVGVFLVLNATRSTTEPEQQVNPQTNIPTNEQAAIVHVAIKNRAFTPKTITVKKGTTVVWTNEDSVKHNAVSDSDAPVGGPEKSAPLLNKGETVSFTYNTVGSFPYHCAPHPDMTGTVEVVE